MTECNVRKFEDLNLAERNKYIYGLIAQEAPFGDLAVKAGLVQSDSESLKTFGSDEVAPIMTFTYNEKTWTRMTRPNINLSLLQQATGIDQERLVKILQVLVDGNVIKDSTKPNHSKFSAK